MKKNFILRIVFLIMIIFLFSCKKVPFFASEGDSLIISSNRSILKTGGERAEITLIGYRANGEIIHDHTSIIITTTLGSIYPVEIEMINGRADVEFTSGNISGEAEIKAISGSIVSEPLIISIVTETFSKLYITADPSNFLYGGGRSKIKVLAVDETGNPMENIPIVLTATNGSFESNKSVYRTNSEGVIYDYLNIINTSKIKAVSGEIESDEIELSVGEQIINTVPIAQFTISPSSPKKGEWVNFNGSLSSDSDGYIVSWDWDFGDGSTKKGEKVNHIYNWAETGNKTFIIVLKVKDNNDATHSTSQSFTISDTETNIAPVSQFAISPTSPKKGETINFNGSLSSDSDGYIVSWDWDFGDGTIKSGEKVTHIYDWAETGNKTFIIVLKVEDNSGASHSSSQNFSITDTETNIDPVSQFTISPTSPEKGETINFNGSSSSDSDGYIVSWDWDFGDGTIKSGEKVTHIYDWTGTGNKTFVVLLKVKDNNDGIHSSSQNITIIDPDTNIDPVSQFTISPTNPARGETVNFNGSLSSDSDGNIVSWVWDFGDGSTGNGEKVNHIYNWTGTENKTFIIVLKVKDNNGAVNSSSQSLTVTAL